MKKILTISAFIFLTAACSQNSMQSKPMTSEQCKQHCMQMMHDKGMVQNHGDMMKDCPMKDCPMMKQHMGNAPRTTPSAPSQ